MPDAPPAPARRLSRLLRWSALGLGAVLLGACGLLYRPDLPRAEAEARWAGPPSQFVQVAGLRLHVRDTGPRHAHPVIMLHGFGSSLHAWDGLAAELEGGWRVVRLDLPGFGLTGPDPAGDYSDARAHAVIAALMDSLGLRRATILGSSMGGRIAWSFAAAEPARVARLVLLAPDGFVSFGREYGRAPRVPLLLRALPYTMPDFLLRRGLAPAYGDPASLTPELFARYRDMLLAPGVRAAIVDRTGQSVLQPPEPLLAGIMAPTLLVWGERDRMIPASHAEDYLRIMPHARAVVLPDIGHVPMEEAPGALADALRAFLREPATAMCEMPR